VLWFQGVVNTLIPLSRLSVASMLRQCRIFQSENNRIDQSTSYISYIIKIRTFMLPTRIRPVYTACMASIASRSSAHRVPITDGRSAEARYLRRVRGELIAQCGGTPTATQHMLIDCIASVSLRINLLDSDVSEHTGREYLDLTVTLAQLLAQLGVQPAAAPSSIMPAISSQHEVAA
jgi:hypothetical protein